MLADGDRVELCRALLADFALQVDVSGDTVTVAAADGTVDGRPAGMRGSATFRCP